MAAEGYQWPFYNFNIDDMKIIHVLFIVAILCFSIQQGSAQSQTKAGYFGITGGLANFGQKQEVTSPFYHVQPGFGFFLHKNIAIGIFLNISSFGFQGEPYTALGLGGSLRFTEKNIFIHAGLDAGLVTDEIFNYSKFTFAIGYSFFISKSFALEPHLFYAAHNESGTTFDFGGPGFGVTIQSYFYRKDQDTITK